MITRIATYKNRKGLSEDLIPQLPFYVINNESEELYFKAESMSQKYYWDSPYKFDKNKQKFHSNQGGKLAVQTGQEIYKTEEEVKLALVKRKVETIKELLPEVEAQYKEYLDFMEKYPEHFL